MASNMRYYRYFSTDLPDEFVEAHFATIAKWATDDIRGSHLEPWPNIRLMKGWTVNGVVIHTFDRGSDMSIHDWMKTHGVAHNGRYWQTFTQSNSSPGGAAGGSGRSSSQQNSVPGTGYVSPITSSHPSIKPYIHQQMGHWAAQLISAGSGGSYQNHLGNAALRTYFIPSTPTPRPDLKREMAVGEITAYRCWLLISDGGKRHLRSVYMDNIWHPNEIMVGLKTELEDWGSRGVHAWKDLTGGHFWEYTSGYTADPEQGLVTGSVLLWGDVVEHEHGYRAEYAKVKSLDWLYPSSNMMGREKEVLDQIRKDYGV